MTELRQVTDLPIHLHTHDTSGNQIAALMMAADAGLVELHEPIVAVAGTGHGADTAVVIRPAPTAEFLDSKVDRIICMPRQG